DCSGQREGTRRPLYSNCYLAQLHELRKIQYPAASFKNSGWSFWLEELASTTAKKAGRLGSTRHGLCCRTLWVAPSIRPQDLLSGRYSVHHQAPLFSMIPKERKRPSFLARPRLRRNRACVSQECRGV